jgi:lipopolysaccharide export system permease protein
MMTTSRKGMDSALDKFENKNLISHLTAMEIQYDTISDAKYHWKISNWKIRKLQGLREHITSGVEKDTFIPSSRRTWSTRKDSRRP